jgi:transketolase C-terminal domain/subunit
MFSEMKLPSMSVEMARDFFSQPQYRKVPALMIWETVKNTSPDSVESREDADWFVNLGLQLVSTFSKMSNQELERLGIDVYGIAAKTDEIHKKFYPQP